jgi:hypothetical protein
MNLDIGDVAGVIAGLKAGQITQQEARKLLHEFGTGDEVIDTVLSVGAGLVVGAAVGSLVDDVFDNIFGGD